jgi:transglutaminase-like putative cysteine protease
MQKKTVIGLILVLFCFMGFSGCLDGLPGFSTMYEPHPTQIKSVVSYGYEVSCRGSGPYEIQYRCDLPTVLKGSVSYDLLYPQEYRMDVLDENQFVRWNVSGSDIRSYTLGIEANVTLESLLVSDLSGAGALSVADIAALHPLIVKQYGGLQANGTTVLIDPFDAGVQAVALQVLDETGVNMSFLLAKALFVWLKENTEYMVHDGQGNVQPAGLTLQKKSGDCDDLSFLYISLCRALGIPARFIRGYLFAETDTGLSATPHAWAEVFVGGGLGNQGWIPVECACCTPSVEADINQNFGVENAFHLRLFVDQGTNESLITSFSGISYTYGLGRIIEVDAFVNVMDYQVVQMQKLVVSGDQQRSYQ